MNELPNSIKKPAAVISMFLFLPFYSLTLFMMVLLIGASLSLINDIGNKDPDVLGMSLGAIMMINIGTVGFWYIAKSALKFITAMVPVIMPNSPPIDRGAPDTEERLQEF